MKEERRGDGLVVVEFESEDERKKALDAIAERVVTVRKKPSKKEEKDAHSSK